jgi:ureidoglycolate lyase
LVIKSKNDRIGVKLMVKKTIKELNFNDFRKYGNYSDMLKPEGIKFGEEPVEFFRDMVQQKMDSSCAVSYSLCRLIKREYIVEASEYHNYSGETIIPLDGDILMHVGPASANDEVPVEDIEIYRVPKGTLVCINPGVWHQAAFAYKCDSVNILVALPERAYVNDCHLITLEPDKKIEILV